MTRIIERLDAIAQDYRALLCDVWGVYHDGLHPFPEALAALRAFRERGGTVLLLTNAPRPAASVQHFLDRLGAPRDSHDAIMSSGEACQRALADGHFGRRFHYVGPERDLHMLSDAGLASEPVERAEAILCTGLDDEETEHPGDYASRIADWVARGLPMLCANPDIVVDRGTERLWCAGAIAQAFAEAGGRVIWFGKPHAEIYEQSLSRLAELMGRTPDRAEILAIGDGVATDVAGAAAAGIDCLFVTGGLAAAEVGDDPAHPDPERLARWLDAHGVSPACAIGRLR